MTTHGIAGKVVLIAGGAKNLGGLLAQDLATHGAKAVVLHYNSPSSQAHAQKTAEQVENTIDNNDENAANQFSKVKYLSFPPSKANRNDSKFPLSAKTAELKYSELGVMIDNDVAAANQTTFTSESSQTLSIKALVSPNKLVKPSFSSHQDQDLNRKPLLASTEIHTDNLMSPKKGKTTMY